MSATPAIRYHIQPAHPGAHLFRVRCEVAVPAAEGQLFRLPAWIPGSYMIRDFARHVVVARAAAGGRAVALTKLDKDTWQCAPCAGPLSFEWEVHAWDLSVRGAHLDTTHAYFNGSSVFPAVVGQEHLPCAVTIALPDGEGWKHWRVATSLPRAGALPWSAGDYAAADYEELIDHPVEMGEFLLGEFEACGVPHAVAITGRVRVDLERLCRDLKTVCEHHIRFFGEPAPMARYLFLVTAVGEGYGGLEHRASTSLLCGRDDLPRSGEPGDGYRTFLGLCSHEYFHAWNVKRIRPAAFVPCDLGREAYTRLLWVFEGFTSYYDDLALVRSGLIDEAGYLKMLGETATRVWRGPGRLRQSLAESSFDAWNKFYKPDANTPNAVVSYYTKGALVALALDLALRRASAGARSLDDVMRALWARYGRSADGVPEDGIEPLVAELASQDFGAFFARHVHGVEDAPLAELLPDVGLRFNLRPAESGSDNGGRPGTRSEPRADLGLRTQVADGELRVSHVLDGGPAQAAGIAAGDVLVALEGLRVQPRGFDRQLDALRPGECVHLHVFRRDELLVFALTLAAAPADTVFISVDGDAADAVVQRRRTWLSGG